MKYSVIHEEVHENTKQLPELSNLIRQKPRQCILRACNNGKRNIKLDQAEISNIVLRSRDSAFTFAVQKVKKKTVTFYLVE